MAIPGTRFRAALVALVLSALLAPPAAAAPGLERKGDKLYYGGKPVRLVGYGDYGLLTESQFDGDKFFAQLRDDNQLNFVRVWVVYHWTHDLSPFAGTWKKWNLQEFNPAFFQRLRAFVAAARAKGVIVQVNLFDSCGLENASPIRWPNSPYNPDNHSPKICLSAGAFDDVGSDLWKKVNKPLVEKVVETLDDMDNVIYEVMNEPNGSLGSKAFNKAVVDLLYDRLHAPAHTGSRIISVNDPYDLYLDPKVDVVAFHINDPAETGKYAKLPKPVIVSNDGDVSQSAKGMGGIGVRTSRVRDFCRNAFKDGSGTGHTHCEILDKDIMCSTWGSGNYDPQLKCLSKSVMATLGAFSTALPLPADAAIPVDCPIGKRIVVDNTPDGASKGGYSETSKNWEYRWDAYDEALGSNYRYLSKYVKGGDGSSKGSARWEAKLPVKGFYALQATFRSTGNRTPKADYYVHDAKGAIVHLVVDQQDGCTGECGHGPVYWPLGIHWFEPGKGFVQIVGNDGLSDEADAMRWTLLYCDADSPPGPVDPEPWKPPAGCPGGGPGPQTRVFHATVVAGASWESPAFAQGPDDGKVTHAPAVSAGQDLAASTFSACDPAGEERIDRVTVGVYSRVQAATGPKAIVLSLSAGGAAKTTISHVEAAWDDLDVTADRPAWTWDDIRSLQVRLSLSAHPGGETDGDVWVDAFRITVTYQPCDFPGTAFCDGIQVRARDACGRPGAILQDCDDGVYCTVDGCSDGACTRSLNPSPACQPIPPQVCEPEAERACIDGVIVFLDGCGNVGGVSDSCDDGNPCTVDGCNPATNHCLHLPTGSCVGCQPMTDLTCAGGILYWVDSCGNLDKPADDCDDQDPCTVDLCDPNGGRCDHLPSGAAGCNCDAKWARRCQGNLLLWVDSCGNVDGIAENCNDGDPCTVDACDKDLVSCTHIKQPGPPCTCATHAGKTCIGGQLVWLDACGGKEGPADSCDDGNPCTADGCDGIEAKCTHESLPDCTPPCASSEPTLQCVGWDVWVVDGCGVVKEMSQDCDDGDPCTSDGCDPEGTACWHLPEQAASGCPVCQASDATACFGGNLVHIDSCGRPAALAMACTDGDPCTLDDCDPAGLACLHLAAPNPECALCIPQASARCEGALVRWYDSCGNPGGLAALCDDQDPCTADGCDPEALLCTHEPLQVPGCSGVPDPECQGAPVATCEGKNVVWHDSCGHPAGVKAACVDLDPCTVDRCDPLLSACAHDPLPTGDCSGPGGDHCADSGKLVCDGKDLGWLDACGRPAGKAKTCDDLDPCTKDGCTGGTCTFESIPGCGPGDLEPDLADRPNGGEEVVGTEAGPDGDERFLSFEGHGEAAPDTSPRVPGSDGCRAGTEGDLLVPILAGLAAIVAAGLSRSGRRERRAG